MPKQDEYVGTYRVRRLSKAEQAIYVPSSITGDFALYIEPNGSLRYVPVGRVARV